MLSSPDPQFVCPLLLLHKLPGGAQKALITNQHSCTVSHESSCSTVACYELIYCLFILFFIICLFTLLTHPFKARKEALKEAFTGVRHGQGAKF